MKLHLKHFFPASVFPLQHFLVMEKTVTPHKNRQMPFPLPSPAWSKQLPYKDKERSWTHAAASS